MSILQNNQLIVIAPKAPMSACGVSDYAYLTAKELTKFYKLVGIGVAQVPTTTEPIFEKSLSITSWQQMLSKVRSSGESSDLLLNYTPTSYAWSGWSIGLIMALRRFKRANPNNRLFVFIHETWNGSPQLRLHHRIRDRLTKWSIGQIGSLANTIAVVTEEQKQKLETNLVLGNIHLSLVGANILPIDKEAGLKSTRQLGIWIVFGLAHTRLWALQAHLPLIKSLHERGFLFQLRSIGPKDNTYARQEDRLISDHVGNNVLMQCGILETAELSQELLNADAALVGQNADSLRKSGTFAALAAHAVPVVCDVPTTLTEPPGDSLFRPDELLIDPELVHKEEGERRRRHLHSWFWETRSWEAIGNDLRNWMDGCNK